MLNYYNTRLYSCKVLFFEEHKFHKFCDFLENCEIYSIKIMTFIRKLTCQSFCEIHFCQLVLFKFGMFVKLIAFEKVLYIIRS